MCSLIKVRCEGHSEQESDRVIWPSVNGVAAGVFRITNQQTLLPVVNNSDQSVVFKEGEEIGHWCTD